MLSSLSPVTFKSFNSCLPQIPQEETDNSVRLFKYPFPKSSLEIVIFIIDAILDSSLIISKTKGEVFL